MISVGDRAPKIELKSADGKSYSLDDKLTLAIFFKTSCPTCQYAWPFYERLYQAYKGADLAVWGISQHDWERTREYANEYQANFPHLVDEGLQVSRLYDPQFVPTGFLIGPRREILKTLVSWNREDLKQLSRAIASKLGVAEREIIKRDENVVAFKPG